MGLLEVLRAVHPFLRDADFSQLSCKFWGKLVDDDLLILEFGNRPLHKSSIFCEVFLQTLGSLLQASKFSKPPFSVGPETAVQDEDQTPVVFHGLTEVRLGGKQVSPPDCLS